MSGQRRPTAGVRPRHGDGVGGQEDQYRSWSPKQGGKDATQPGRKPGRPPGTGPELQGTGRGRRRSLGVRR